MQADQLIAELLATGSMNDDTVLDLNRMLADWRNGKLDPDDAAYLEAFHTRIMNSPPTESENSPQPTAPPRLDGLTIEEWKDRALRAETTLAELEETARAV